jgi:gas vesicle protein
MTNIFWIISGIVALILLIKFYWNRPNAVWGGLRLGVIIGFVVAIFFAYKEGSELNWYTIGKIAIVGVVLGFGLELLGTLSDYLKKKKS